jgi:hypothetical protein
MVIISEVEAMRIQAGDPEPAARRDLPRPTWLLFCGSVGALRGCGKEEILSPRYTPVPGYWDHQPLVPEIDEIACGSFKHKNSPEIQGSGYVVRSL